MAKRLELTWVGKGNEHRLEPRILLRDPEHSYGDENTENMLIYGDNLLTLKALEQKFTGKIKCIYIDPPYNTKNIFEFYDDNLEHSIWLDLMSQRIRILHKLLSNDGVIIVHIDDNEKDYLKVMMDGIFGRSNFVNTIVVRDSHPSGLKLSSASKTIIKTKSYMLVYKKRDLVIRPIYQVRHEWDTHFNMFMDTTKETLIKESLKDVLLERGIIAKGEKVDKSSLGIKKFRDFCFENRAFIFQSTKELPDGPRIESRKKKDIVIKYETSSGPDYALNGRRMSPLTKSIKQVGIDGDTREDFAKMLCDFWEDVPFNNTQNEGGVKFPNSKKPEFLVGRLLTMFSQKGDLVLDSFLGSGTTAAVAHKMGRRWIGIELGDHAKTHCYPRLKAVVDGEQSGISTQVGWKGGGGFHFWELAPSLLNQDEFKEWVISKEYDPEMLAAAIAKQEGFTYQPDPHIYWKQGFSSEKDFIFTTTRFITVEKLERIHDELGEEESLLIACKKFQAECVGKFSNISITKIPVALLGKCEFGRDDYSLNILEPEEEESSEIDYDEIPSEAEEESSESEEKPKPESDGPQLRLF